MHARHLGVLLTVGLFSCAKVGPLQDYYDEVSVGLQQAENNDLIKNCAPRELALAESHQAFAALEFEQGDTRRAEEHLLIARENMAAALELGAMCAPTDRDGDGINDDDDQCPDRPETMNGIRDMDGCPDGDRDNDTIADDDDQCVDQPEDLDNFMDSDGCPDLDNDNDGIPDTMDSCPTIPEDLDGDADEDGCPEDATEAPDSDGDGIADGLDQCPNEAETMNSYLDEDGCPDAAPQNVQITREAIQINDKIQFQAGKARILPVSYGLLNAVAQVMQDYSSIRVSVEGHTDSDGSDSFNMNLSESRANAVREYLISQGVSSGRLVSKGYGETRPIDTNRTSSGKANNRRVEFRIIEGME